VFIIKTKGEMKKKTKIKVEFESDWSIKDIEDRLKFLGYKKLDEYIEVLFKNDMLKTPIEFLSN